eukprot:g33811.t1
MKESKGSQKQFMQAFITTISSVMGPEANYHSYALLNIVGSSQVSSDDAIRNAIAKAGTMVENLRWFEVVETRGHLENGKVAHWQVVVRIGHTL